MKAGDQVWYVVDSTEQAVAFVVTLNPDGTVATLWAQSRDAGGVLWADNPPQGDPANPQPGTWLPLV